MLRLSLAPFIRFDAKGKRFVNFRIDQTMYGLKESGQLSQRRLISLLLQSGFVESSTPCLFRHLTRPIAFVLVVDDFGVKYTDLADFDFLVSALSPLYHVKAHPIADKFLGSTIRHDLAQHTLTVAYAGYIDALL